MEKVRPHIVVISNAVEKDNAALKQFLRQNGVANTDSLTKDQLQRVITVALSKDRRFYDQFRVWVIKRSGALSRAKTSGYAAADGVPALLSTDVYGPQNDPALSSATNAPGTKEAPGFWSDIDMNSILNFAATNFNTWADVTKSNNEKDIVNAAIEKERLQQQTVANNTSAGTKPKTGWYIFGAVAGLAVLGTAIYLVTKKTK